MGNTWPNTFSSETSMAPSSFSLPPSLITVPLTLLRYRLWMARLTGRSRTPGALGGAEHGYFRLAKDVESKHGMCGVARVASYPVKSGPNPKDVPEVCGWYVPRPCLAALTACCPCTTASALPVHDAC